LPGREFVADGYTLLGQDLPWLPLSLTPHETMATALALLPPFAVLAAMLRLGAYKENWLAGAILLGALASVLLGVLQVTTDDRSWYLYRFSAFNAATGFFANSNHTGALLLVSLPFLLAIAADQRDRLRESQSRSMVAALAAGGAILLGTGIVINGSSAILLLGPPVAAASILMLIRQTPNRVRRGFGLVAILLAAGAAAVATLADGEMAPSSRTSITERAVIWARSAAAIGDHMPSGSGIGSFEPIYERYEDLATIDRFYVNHAHNDFLEVALETGVAGVLLLLAFLAWWTVRAGNAWRSPVSSYYGKAASIASATLLLHSFVDFPLRTAALSSVMAMCLALLARPRGVERGEKSGELWPTRHRTL
jgi:O-antigen ligase